VAEEGEENDVGPEVGSPEHERRWKMAAAQAKCESRGQCERVAERGEEVRWGQGSTGVYIWAGGGLGRWQYAVTGGG
jgi:hypothetical protein